MTHRSYAIATTLIRICMLAGQIAVSPSAAAQSALAPDGQRPALMHRQQEIALALSACPMFVADKRQDQLSSGPP
jgi:hypothetical protein